MISFKLHNHLGAEGGRGGGIGTSLCSHQSRDLHTYELKILSLKKNHLWVSGVGHFIRLLHSEISMMEEAAQIILFTYTLYI